MFKKILMTGLAALLVSTASHAAYPIAPVTTIMPFIYKTIEVTTRSRDNSPLPS